MRIIVLGAAAGGGFPQWNANHEACRRARDGDPAARPATQASIALSADGERWVLVNAAPDLREQINATPALWPRDGLRSSPIAAILLTNADIDAVAGLLHLREGTPFALYGHARVLDTLAANAIFNVVDHKIVPRRPIEPGLGHDLRDAGGELLGLRFEAFTAPGKIPLFREGEAGAALDTAAEEGDTLGLEIACAGRRLVYLANCARITPAVRARVEGADLLFMDGTLWRDDEMIRMGVGTKTGQRMGHVSMSGPEGVIEQLEGTRTGRRLFIHINNTNPVLLADSDERAQAQARGWEIARDGMEIRL